MTGISVENHYGRKNDTTGKAGKNTMEYSPRSWNIYYRVVVVIIHYNEYILQTCDTPQACVTHCRHEVIKTFLIKSEYFIANLNKYKPRPELTHIFTTKIPKCVIDKKWNISCNTLIAKDLYAIFQN